MNSKSITIPELESSLCQYINKNIVDSKISIEPGTSFSSLRMDSLSIVELVLYLERQYDIIIPETDLVPENFKSVSTLARCAFRCLNHG